jgi:MIP family channel proteins
MMNKWCAEFFGTFCLVFAGTGAIVINDVSGGQITHVGIALTFGLIVTAMIYAIGDVSGAHLNPAVTIGFVASKRMKAAEIAPYFLAQAAGAVAASGLLRAMFAEHATLGATLPRGAALQSFVLELVMTFMLMYVILCVSTGPKETGVLAGIAIGGVIALEAMFGGPISGASMNPVRSLAPAVVSGRVEHLWVYVVAPVLGALLAVPAWRLSRPGNN